MRQARLTILILGMLLSACASRVASEVTTFHHLPPPAGEIVTIEVADPAKDAGLEFANYRDQVAQRLGDLGYEVRPAGTPCDLVAKIDYRVGPGESRVRTYTSNTHVWYHFRHNYYHPYWYRGYDPWWDDVRVYSYTVYPRELTLTIDRGSACREGSPGDRLFEGRAESVGRSRNMSEIMPYLIAAMFENFPGESGMTKVITIEGDSDETGPR